MSVGGWFCGGLVWFKDRYYFGSFPSVWYFVVSDRAVADICECS